MSEKIYLVRSIFHNVQSHKHTVVEWDKSLNVIIGANDSGKTAMQRGLNWNFYNESSSEFIRKKDNEVDKHGRPKEENMAYVSNLYSNGITITRKYEKNTNIYEVIDENGEVFLFDGFRGDVPEMVSKLSGISPMVITENLNLNLNIVASRGRSLIDLNGAEKAQVIGAFAQANVIDISIKEANAEIKRNNDSMSKAKQEIAKLSDEIENMGDMKEQENLVKQIDELFFSLSEMSFVKNDVLNLKESIESRKKELTILTEKVKSLADVEEQSEYLKTIGEALYKIKDSVLDLNQKKERILIIKSRIETRKKEILESKEILKKHGDLLSVENELLKTEVFLSNIMKKFEQTADVKAKALKYSESIKNRVSLINRDKSVVETHKNVLKEEAALEKTAQKLNSIKDEFKRVQEQKTGLVKLKSSILDKRTLEAAAKEKIRNLNNEIEMHTENCVDMIKDMGKCPLCFSNIDDAHLVSIRKELEE